MRLSENVNPQFWGPTMPNYKSKMHRKKYPTEGLRFWHLMGLHLAACGAYPLRAHCTTDWLDVTCVNCLRCRPKGETDGR